MSETTPKKRGPGRPKKIKPKRRTRFWDAMTHKLFERRMRAYLVALNVSQAGKDHLADLKVVDERAEEVIGMIDEFRGL
jgi:hypothetical protein